MSDIRPGEVVQWLDEDADHVLEWGDAFHGSRDRVTSTMWAARDMIQKQAAEIEHLQAALRDYERMKINLLDSTAVIDRLQIALRKYFDADQIKTVISGKGET